MSKCSILQPNVWRYRSPCSKQIFLFVRTTASCFSSTEWRQLSVMNSKWWVQASSVYTNDWNACNSSVSLHQSTQLRSRFLNYFRQFWSRFPNFFGQCKQKIDGSLLCNAVFMPSVYDCIAYSQILAWRCRSRVSGPGDMFAWNESWVFWRDGVFHETICQINPKFLDKVCWTFGVTFQLYWELGDDIVSSPSIRWMHTANWKGDLIFQTNTLADSCQIKTIESKKMLKN